MKRLGSFYPIGISMLFAALLLRHDILNYAVWWLTLLGLGAIFFPLSSFIFHRFQSKGYIFSKVVGLSIGGYITWLAGSARILPFRPWAVYLVLAVCLAVNILIGKKTKIGFQALRDKEFVWRITKEEALFMALLAFWCFLRGIKPDMQEDLEKYMDFGFVNSALRGEFFPPVDMWYAGKGINYYYLGQYFTAYLTRVSFLDKAVTYNLMMATLFALVFMQAFTIGQFLFELYAQNDLGRKVAKKARLVAGMLSGALVCLSGSLHTVVYAWFGGGGPYGFYWYPDATRYIGYNPPVFDDETIHEFPLYSYVVSDLHAHVLNMLFVLTALGAAIAAGVGIMKKFRQMNEDKYEDKYEEESFQPERKKSFKDFIPEASYFLAIFLIGLFPATNFWDFPIYLVVSGAIYFYANLKACDFKFKGLIVAFVQVAVTGIVSYLVVLPFQMSFDPISSKIELVKKGSMLYQLVVLYGYQAAFFVMLLLETYYLYKRPAEPKPLNIRKGKKNKPQETIAVPSQPLTIAPSSAQASSVPLLAFLEKTNPADVIAGILFVCAFGLIIIPEIIYVKDIYPTSPRANTMFKLCYQAFIMLCLAIGYTYPRLFMHHGEKDRRYLITASLGTILLFCAFVYPFYAIPGGYGSLSLGNYKGLNGIKFMETYEAKVLDRSDENEVAVQVFVDDAPIVEYLNKVKGQPVICEANHYSYTVFGRIASFTGLPDIFNWYTHQELWRSSKFDEFTERVDDIQKIYCGDDPAVTTSILQKYNVKYIVVGLIERTKFG
ncbi:MAG: DUF2298 domain-containing protein, partial [Clostridiales bacterium]|nr:DUF2298 domain-containing protein [Clostridiales bacterium]